MHTFIEQIDHIGIQMRDPRAMFSFFSGEPGFPVAFPYTDYPAISVVVWGWEMRSWKSYPLEMRPVFAMTRRANPTPSMVRSPLMNSMSLGLMQRAFAEGMPVLTEYYRLDTNVII